MNCHVYVDFDGTIMSCDTTDFLFERFALPEWRGVEEEWAAGRIGSRVCMARQVDLLRATPEQISAAIAEIDIDPGFASFLGTCADAGIGTTIVSDGLDFVIDATLRRYGLSCAFFANRLISNGRDRWRLEFPHAREACEARAGHCKCARTQAHQGQLKVVVGDGRSDFCIAGRADLVLAKSKLLEACRAAGTPHLPFADFFEVSALLEGWLGAGPVPHDGAMRVPLPA